MNQVLDSTALKELNGTPRVDDLRGGGKVYVPGFSSETIVFDLSIPHRRRDQLIEEYWSSHPRFRFLKSLRERCCVVDLGAGAGGLATWTEWCAPIRRDLLLYAVDRRRGEHFGRYADFDLVDLGKDETKFPDESFDAVVASHLIDYVENRTALVAEMMRIMRPGATAYIEWPSPRSAHIISRVALNQFGIPCGTLNYFDDAERVAPGRLEPDVAFAEAGFDIVQSGTISNDFLFPELFRLGIAEADEEVTTYALWLALGVGRFAIIRKPYAELS